MTTRFLRVLEDSARRLHRELKIALTRDVREAQWIFIVGCYNSGTELLLKLLGSHPAISSLPTEGHFLADDLPKDFVLGVPRMWMLREDLFRLTEKDPGPDPVRLRREWLMRLDRRKRVFVEKTPSSTPRTRWLQRHFENAHFIALVRDGYAVSEGIRRKAEPRHLMGGWPIELCARQWTRSYEILFEDEPHLERVMWLRYEDLTEDPSGELGKLASFLGVPAQGFQPDGKWAIHERKESIRNLNAESVARLTVEDLEAITREAGAMLKRFGYPLRP